MLLSPGTRLGPYLVDAQIGAGGMGEVYRATDPRLGREVAVKILPASFAEDGDRLRRFEQEARVIAALNHPNLLSLFDTGIHEGSPYLVTELLEGETLRQWMGGKPTPVKKAVEIALQIAHGLAAAHDQSIVHRDLKPENVFVTREGRVKILDFGLAKLWKAPLFQGGDTVPLEGVARQADPAMTPLFSSEAGVILGTVGYMAPEQIRAETVDGRADIFAFGAILFELLMGRPPFKGENAIDTMHAILSGETPELDPQLPGLTPVLDHIVRRCLEKKPERRFQSLHDLAFAMEHTTGSGPSPNTGPWPRVERRRAGPRRKAFAQAMTLGLILGLGVAGAALIHFKPFAKAPILTFRTLTYSGTDAMPSASPDGKTLAFTSDRDGRPRIWLKQLGGGSEVALTEGPDDAPRFNSDGTSILFHRSLQGPGALYRVTALGGDVQKVVDQAEEGDWSPDGRKVVFLRPGGDQEAQLGVVSLQEGGERVLRTLPLGAAHPRWSPDGKRILLTGSGGRQGQGLLLVDAASGALTTLQPRYPDRPASAAVWVAPDRFLYLQPDREDEQNTGGGATLFAQRSSGAPPEPVAWTPSFSRVLDRLGPGRLVLEEVKTRSSLKLVALDRSEPPRWLNRGDAIDRAPALSPDGRRLAFSSNRGGAENIWVLDLDSQALHRVTDHTGRDTGPAFAPDGKHLFWSSDRGGSFEIWTSEVEGGPPAQVSHDGAQAEDCVVAPDGVWVYYHSGHPEKGGIWRVHPDGGDPERIVPEGSDPALSPDGGLLAYRVAKGPSTIELRLVDLRDRRTLPFAITLALKPGTTPSPFLGHARWTPDGRRLAFINQEDGGAVGIAVQDIPSDHDTTSTRRALTSPDPDDRMEGFVFTLDGARIIAAERQRLTGLAAMEGLGPVVPAPPPR